jgi:hypothetical protein
MDGQGHHRRGRQAEAAHRGGACNNLDGHGLALRRDVRDGALRGSSEEPRAWAKFPAWRPRDRAANLSLIGGPARHFVTRYVTGTGRGRGTGGAQGGFAVWHEVC